MGRHKTKPIVVKICKQCKKEFETDKQDRKFCSQRCYHDSKAKPILYCSACSLELKGYKHYNEYTNLFCSKKCQGDFLRKPFNEHFFEDETPEVAYWAGFLMADGSTRKRKWCNTSLSLTLSEQDVEHMQKFCKSIELDENNIKILKRKPNHKYKRNNECKIDIVSPHLEKSLEKWGIIPNKTYIGEFPDIDENLYKHYIRGLIDGDGCIWLSGKNKGITLSGNEHIIKSTSSIIYNILNVELYINYREHKKTGNKLWIWDVRNYNNVIKLGDWLYTDNPFMDRKHQKFQLIKERYDKK